MYYCTKAHPKGLTCMNRRINGECIGGLFCVCKYKSKTQPPPQTPPPPPTTLSNAVKNDNRTMRIEIEKKKRSTTMKIKLDENAKMPTRAHETDAGLDIYARETKTILVGDSAIFDTGVHIEIPAGYVGFLKSKSGLNVNCGITSEGVIDCGYTGSVVVKLYNNGDDDYTVNAGDKISQLVLLPILIPELELVDTLEDTDRGNGGFGSTGK